MWNDLQCGLVQLVYEGDTGGNIQLCNYALGNVVQMLNESTQGVAVGSNYDAFATLNVGDDDALPKRKHSL